MPGDSVFVLTVAFALITGTSAGLLSLLSLEILRQSPLGRVMFLFSIAMALFIFYHILVLIVPASTGLTHLVPSVMYTIVAAAIWLIALIERRILRRTTGVENPS